MSGMAHSSISKRTHRSDLLNSTVWTEDFLMLADDGKERRASDPNVLPAEVEESVPSICAATTA